MSVFDFVTLPESMRYDTGNQCGSFCVIYKVDKTINFTFTTKEAVMAWWNNDNDTSDERPGGLTPEQHERFVRMSADEIDQWETDMRDAEIETYEDLEDASASWLDRLLGNG